MHRHAHQGVLREKVNDKHDYRSPEKDRKHGLPTAHAGHDQHDRAQKYGKSRNLAHRSGDKAEKHIAEGKGLPGDAMERKLAEAGCLGGGYLSKGSSPGVSIN